MTRISKAKNRFAIINLREDDEGGNDFDDENGEGGNENEVKMEMNKEEDEIGDYNENSEGDKSDEGDER